MPGITVLKFTIDFFFFFFLRKVRSEVSQQRKPTKTRTRTGKRVIKKKLKEETRGKKTREIMIKHSRQLGYEIQILSVFDWGYAIPKRCNFQMPQITKA